VGRGGDSYTGSAPLEYFDLAGNLVFSFPTADVYGQRITVD